MGELRNNVFEALRRYFASLAYTGYHDDVATFKLIIAVFIERMLDGLFAAFVSEKDMTSLATVVGAMTGSTCMLSFQDNGGGDSVERTNRNPEAHLTRLDSDGVVRLMEDGSQMLLEEPLEKRSHVLPMDAYEGFLHEIDGDDFAEGDMDEPIEKTLRDIYS